MPFVALTVAETDRKSPVDEDLMNKIRLNFDDHESRIGVGGGGASGLEALKQKTEYEHSLIEAEPLHNSVRNSFNKPDIGLLARLVEDYAATTTVMRLCWNPIYQNDSDKNTDTTTNFTGQGSFANLTTSATAKVGSASISIDKTSGTTNTRIRYDRGSANFNIYGNDTLYFWINIPSLTNFDNVEVRIDINGTDYQTFTSTVDHTGAALTTGWNLMKFDLRSGGTASGAGWTRDKYFQFVHYGINTTSSSQTYTNVLFDFPVFSLGLDTIAQYVQKGIKLSIYDSSLVDDFIISSASAAIEGTITLAASMSNSYSAGTGTSIKRNTFQILGDNVAYMNTGLSGNVGKQQTARLQRYLDETMTSQTIKSFMDLYTNAVLKVTAVNSSTEFEVEDFEDLSDDVVSGAILHVFKANYNPDASADFADKEMDLTVASSAWASDVLTITNSGSNTGIAVGDYVALKLVSNAVSLTTETANENFQASTIEKVRMFDIGIPYHNPQFIKAHFPLGSFRGSIGLSPKGGISKTTVPAQMAGSIGLQSGGPRNGVFSAGGFTTSTNWLYVAPSTGLPSQLLAVSGFVEVSFWFYFSGSAGAIRRVVCNHADSGAGYGWQTYIDNSQSYISLNMYNAGPYTAVNSQTLSVGWHHCVAHIEVNNFYMIVDGVKSTVGATSTATARSDSYIEFGGRGADGAQGFTNGYLLDVVFQINGDPMSVDTASRISKAYRPYAIKPTLAYDFTNATMTGIKLAQESKTIRTTDDVEVFLSKIGAIKV